MLGQLYLRFPVPIPYRKNIFEILMLQEFFKTYDQPFNLSPDPRYLYLSRTHREAVSSLLYRIQTDSGFLAMVAQPGMGKTMMLFYLLERLRKTARTAFIFQTQCTYRELLQQIVSELECSTDLSDPTRMSHDLKNLLVKEAHEGRRCIVIIDEAQNLGAEVLETVRLLSNFETPRRKLLQIILSGQEELGAMLGRPELRQLKQRLTCTIQLRRLDADETVRYIAHRIRVSGFSGDLTDLFSVPALLRVWQLSEGVPRVVNNLCSNAIALGFALGREKIDAEIIDEAAKDLDVLGDEPHSIARNDCADPYNNYSGNNGGYKAIADACESLRRECRMAPDELRKYAEEAAQPDVRPGSPPWMYSMLQELNGNPSLKESTELSEVNEESDASAQVRIEGTDDSTMRESATAAAAAAAALPRYPASMAEYPQIRDSGEGFWRQLLFRWRA
jgi:general secretion pathway protein A